MWYSFLNFPELYSNLYYGIVSEFLGNRKNGKSFIKFWLLEKYIFENWCKITRCNSKKIGYILCFLWYLVEKSFSNFWKIIHPWSNMMSLTDLYAVVQECFMIIGAWHQAAYLQRSADHKPWESRASAFLAVPFFPPPKLWNLKICLKIPRLCLK